MKIWAVIIIALLSGVSFGQAADTNPAAKPLLYKISLYKIDRKTKSITLKLRIRNVSGRNVIIDKNAVRYEVRFERKGRRSPDSGIGPGEALTMTGDPSADYRGDFILLRPRGVYNDSKTLYIDDAFFDKNRVFVLSLTYGLFRDYQVDGLVVWKGVITSNEISFKN